MSVEEEGMSRIRFGTALLEGTVDNQQRATLHAVNVSLADSEKTLILRGYPLALADAGNGRSVPIVYKTERTPTATGLFTAYRGVKLLSAEYRSGAVFDRYLTVSQKTESTTVTGDQTFRGVRLATNTNGTLLAVIRAIPKDEDDDFISPDDIAKIALNADVLTVIRYGTKWYPLIYVV